MKHTSILYETTAKLVKHQYILQMSHNMVNISPLTAEIGPVVWAPQLISTGFASWQRYCTAVK